MADKNLFQKLVEIRKEVDKLCKDTEGYKYKYVSGSQVLSKIRPKMDELGVLLKSEILETKWSTVKYVNSKNTEVTDFIVESVEIMTFINADNPEDREEYKWFSAGQQDDISKAFGSGLTYSERYFLMKQFNIPTDEEDPDGRQDDKKYTSKASGGTSNKGLSEAQVKRLFAIARKAGYAADIVKKQVLNKYGTTEINSLTKQQYDELCGGYEKLIKEA